MKQPLVRVLLGCAGLLVLLILGEWISGMARIARIEAPPRLVSAAPDQKVVTAATGASDEQVDAWLQSVLARPLMSASRSPAAKSGGPALALNGGLPRLAGMLIGMGGEAAGNTAIFARDDGGKPLIVHQGGSLGPWRITRIEAGGVTLEGPEGRQTLHPRFGTGPATAASDDAQGGGPGFAPPFVPGQNLPGQNLPGVGQPGFPVQNFPGLPPPPAGGQNLQSQAPSQ